MGNGDLLGRIIRLDSGNGTNNFHDYVAIAYNTETDEYLLVNFTTPIGDGNLFSIKITKREFPAILKHDSEVEFRRPEEISAADLKSKARKAPNGSYYLCPYSVISKIKTKIKEGTEMPRKFSQKYGL